MAKHIKYTWLKKRLKRNISLLVWTTIVNLTEVSMSTKSQPYWWFYVPNSLPHSYIEYGR